MNRTYAKGVTWCYMSYTIQWRIKGTETGVPTLLLRQTEAKISFDEGPSLTLESGQGLDEFKIFTNLCTLINPLPIQNCNLHFLVADHY